MPKLERGDQFKIKGGCHTGRLYTVANFAPCKFGVRFAICTWTDNPGDAFLFSESDINDFGYAFEMWDTTSREKDTVIFDRIDKQRAA